MTQTEPSQDFSYKKKINGRHMVLRGEYVIVPHIYYPNSGDHFWKGRRWSKQEWDTMVNKLDKK